MVLNANRSPLILKGRFITELSVVAVPYDGSAPSDLTYSNTGISVEHHFSWNEKFSNWNGHITAICWPEVPEGIPYRFRVKAFGVFEVGEEIAEAERIKFVSINGGSVLLGMVRDAIRNATLEGPYPHVDLPLFFFSIADDQSPSEDS